jgi:hypothetical protein
VENESKRQTRRYKTVTEGTELVTGDGALHCYDETQRDIHIEAAQICTSDKEFSNISCCLESTEEDSERYGIGVMYMRGGKCWR